MYVCMYVCMYVYIYIYIYIYIYTRVNESCLGSAVKGAFMAMKHIGGKLIVCGACIPSVGEWRPQFEAARRGTCYLFSYLSLSLYIYIYIYMHTYIQIM